jgi:stress-induced-phosphoprotein 1
MFFQPEIAKNDVAFALDDSNMTFLNNKAAVYFSMKEYNTCIQTCKDALEVGKANFAPFEDRAKAFTRMGKCHQKQKDLGEAIEAYKNAQLEHHTKDTERLLKNLELEKKKSDKLKYQDPEKAQEAKQRGNDLFRAQKWGEAVIEYEEAVKRNPKDAPIRNNLAAGLCKIMDFNAAKAHIDEALDLDPKYVKAWARKGDIHVLMKENHKAIDAYRKGFEIDETNKACKEGIMKVQNMINAGNQNMTEEERRERAEHGMADPEVQAILTDPVIRQVLQDFQENPNAAQQAMRDPTVNAKIEKLIAAGVLQVGRG